VPISVRLELGHSLKTEPNAAGFGNMVFGQIFSACYQDWFLPTGLQLSAPQSCVCSSILVPLEQQKR